MKLPAREYIAYMEKAGLFSADSPVPECNSRAWRGYLDLYEREIDPAGPPDIIVTPGGLGFYYEPLDDDRLVWSWALHAPISHPRIPFTAAQLVALTPEIAPAFAAQGIEDPWIVTDTFAFATPHTAADEKYFTWLNSPQARLCADREAYAISLEAKRRKQMRRLFRSYDEAPDIFRFDFSQQPPNAAEMDFIREHTQRRWKEEASYALVQTLWPMAVSQAIPEAVRYMRVYANGKLVFVNSFLVRDDTIYSQATCRSEDEMFSGLGTMIDFKVIDILSSPARAATNLPDIAYLDPTCRTTLDDPENIGIAKREVVNHDYRRPLFLLGAAARFAAAPATFYDPATGWSTPAEPLVLGRAA